MSRKPSRDNTPLPGSVMPLQDEHRLVRKTLNQTPDNWLRGRRKAVGSRDHYSDQDDQDQTIPI